MKVMLMTAPLPRNRVKDEKCTPGQPGCGDNCERVHRDRERQEDNSGQLRVEAQYQGYGTLHACEKGHLISKTD